MKSNPTILFGPFIGELNWEFYHFAPYAIHLKKKTPEIKIIVLTRPERFDLYGKYSNVLVPLYLKNNEEDNQNKFMLNNFTHENYINLIRMFYLKFQIRDTLDIKKHYYPDIKGFRYQIKWQFPRHSMDYNFAPREGNEIVIKDIDTNNLIFLDSLSFKSEHVEKIIKDLKALGLNIIDYYELEDLFENAGLKNSTLIGSAISLIKKCSFVIGNLNSSLSRLSLLLKTPVLSLDEKLTNDAIHLINPKNTDIVKTDNIIKGVEKCESYLI